MAHQVLKFNAPCRVLSPLQNIHSNKDNRLAPMNLQSQVITTGAITPWGMMMGAHEYGPSSSQFPKQKKYLRMDIPYVYPCIMGHIGIGHRVNVPYAHVASLALTYRRMPCLITF